MERPSRPRRSSLTKFHYPFRKCRKSFTAFFIFIPLRTAVFTILKNVMMLAVLSITLIYVFSAYMRLEEFLLLFYITGAAYLLAGFIEAYSYKALVKNKADLFNYVTDSAIAKSILKIILFLGVGILLYTSGSMIRYLAFICFLRSALELVNLAYKAFTGAMFIYLGQDVINIVTTKPERVYASEVQQINCRHGLVYLIKHDKKTVTLRADVMNEKEVFVSKLRQWASNNGIAVVDEP